MVGSFLAPKWPILVPFCGIDLQKPNFLLISDILAVGGCWGQPMLLFWKLADETEMVKPPEPTSHHNSRKCLILLPHRAIYFRSLYYCSSEGIAPAVSNFQLKPWLASLQVAIACIEFQFVKMKLSLAFICILQLQAASLAVKLLWSDFLQ